MYELTLQDAIESINETVTPEWTDFRYVRSPFKVYRYVGVEREIKIDFKVYYWGDVGDRVANGVMLSQQSAVMKAKLNELRKLALQLAGNPAYADTVIVNLLRRKNEVLVKQLSAFYASSKRTEEVFTPLLSVEDK